MKKSILFFAMVLLLITAASAFALGPAPSW